MKDRRTKADLLEELSKNEGREMCLQSHINRLEASVKQMQADAERQKAATEKQMEQIKQAIRTAAAMRYPNSALDAWEGNQIFHNGRYITLETEPETEEFRLIRLLYSMCSS